MRNYRQACGVAKALDVVGERWTLLIIRNLLLGGQRYKDLLETLPGITTNLLAARLRALEAAGLLAARRTPAPTPATLYELTARGHELEPVVLALGRFGAPYLEQPKRGDRRHVRWAMLSLKRRFAGGAGGRRVQLAVGEASFALASDGDQIAIRQGSDNAAQASATLDEAAFIALAFGGASLRELIAGGGVRVEGDVKAFSEVMTAIQGVHA